MDSARRVQVEVKQSKKWALARPPVDHSLDWNLRSRSQKFLRHHLLRLFEFRTLAHISPALHSYTALYCIMFKRVEKRIWKKEKEEELGLDSEMKEVLGLQDTDSEESDSSSDNDSDGSDSDDEENAIEGNDEEMNASEDEDGEDDDE